MHNDTITPTNPLYTPNPPYTPVYPPFTPQTTPLQTEYNFTYHPKPVLKNLKKKLHTHL